LKKSQSNHENDLRIEDSDRESIDENNYNFMEEESVSDTDYFDENNVQAMGNSFGVQVKRKTDVGGVNDDHMAVDLAPKNLFPSSENFNFSASSNVSKPLRTENVMDQMVKYLNHAKESNVGFKEVKIVENHDYARDKLLDYPYLDLNTRPFGPEHSRSEVVYEHLMKN
jgi:RAB protein geranylgeranyltransferase component A